MDLIRNLSGSIMESQMIGTLSVLHLALGKRSGLCKLETCSHILLLVDQRFPYTVLFRP